MMKKIVLSLLLAGILYSQQQIDIPWPTLAGSPWPMIKHDPQFTGRSPYRGPQTPNIIWTVDMEDGIFSGPVIGEKGNLYFGSYYVHADNFYSYSPDGKFLWEYKLGRIKPPQAGIIIDSSNTIYFGSLDGYLYALNADGTLKWEYETSAPIVEIAIPNIDLQGNIYITNGFGELYSIKPDGTLNWSVSYENGFFPRSPVFSPDGSTVYVAGRDSNLFALNLDGSLEWKFSCGIIQRSPMIDSDGNIYFIPYSPQYFHSISPEGNIRWKKVINSVGYAIPTIDSQGNLYTIAIDSSSFPDLALFSFDYEGNFRWSYVFDDEENDDFWQPLICDSEGSVYVGSTFGHNYYAISSEGDLKWKLALSEDHQQVDNTGAIAEDGTLYLGVHDVSLFTDQVKTLIAIRDTGTVSVKENNVEIEDYSLSQNYPNPFNPSTKIKYQLPNSGIVILKIYDILGRKVTTLVNEFKSAGSYEIKFNANDLSSGVYIYRITASNNGRILFTDSKQMLLTK